MSFEDELAASAYAQTGAKPAPLNVPDSRHSANYRTLEAPQQQVEPSLADERQEMVDYQLAMYGPRSSPEGQQAGVDAYYADALSAQQPDYEYADPNEHPLVQMYEDAVMSGDSAQQLAIQAYLTQQTVQSSLNAAVDQSINAETEQKAAENFAAAAERVAAQRYGEGWDEVSGPLAKVLERNPDLFPDGADLDTTANRLASLAKTVKLEMEELQTPPIGRAGGGTPEAAAVLQAMMRRVR
jgi:hypothetical protein